MFQKLVFSGRSFLQGLAAGVVVGGATVGASWGVFQQMQPVYWKSLERWDLESDVVVVGFGVVGSAAARSRRQRC